MITPTPTAMQASQIISSITTLLRHWQRQVDQSAAYVTQNIIKYFKKSLRFYLCISVVLDGGFVVSWGFNNSRCFQREVPLVWLSLKLNEDFNFKYSFFLGDQACQPGSFVQVGWTDSRGCCPGEIRHIFEFPNSVVSLLKHFYL